MPENLSSLSWLHAPMGFHIGGVDQRVESMIGPDARVLNIGAKKMGRPQWINLDIIPHSSQVNLLGDAHFLPLADNSLDAVVMKFVLEHVPDPQKVVKEVFRTLKPGGVFYTTVPFVEPFHADPGDYQRYTLDGLKKLCAGFKTRETGVYYGPASALVEFLREFFAAFFDSAILKKGIRFLAGWVFCPLKFLDVYLARKKHADACAYGIYIVAQKP